MRGFRNHAVLFVCSVSCFCAAVTPTSIRTGGRTASISGRVTDASNAAVPAATVTIKNTATSATQTASTDDQGRYTLLDLPIGPYDITVSKTGFQNAARTGIDTDGRRAPVLDFQLTVGQATETVSVSAEVSQVETTTSAVSSLVNQTQMRELPLNGRDWEQLILLAPGVAELSAGRIERADFGRQCLLHLGYTPGRLRQHAGWRRHAELVAAERRRRRNRHFARYRRHRRVSNADRHLQRAVCRQRRRHRRQ